MTREIRDLLVKADSLLSLVAHRYRASPIPDDVVADMIAASSRCRAAYQAAPAASPAPVEERCPNCGRPREEISRIEDRWECNACGHIDWRGGTGRAGRGDDRG